MGVISFSMNLKSIVKDYEQSYVSFSKKLNQFLEDSEQGFLKLFDNKNRKIHLDEPIKILSPTQEFQTENEYKFSSTFKGYF